MATMLKVVEIFKSIDGEGKRAGLPTTFIRLHKCNLDCTYCDTKYANEVGNWTPMTVQQIVQSVLDYGLTSVTITGGEPLIHNGLYDLLYKLVEIDCCINIETNGSIPIPNIYDNTLRDNIFFTIDYKCPSSGMEDRMCLENFDHINPCDVIKFVVGSEEDMVVAKNIIDKYDITVRTYFSPVFGKIQPKDIVKFILDNDLRNVRVQLQLHKFIWNPDERGV